MTGLKALGSVGGFAERASPNFNERDPQVFLRYVVLHYTGMASAQEWMEAVCDPKTELSAHYIIDEKGLVTRIVDESKRAWHAGKSFWRGITDMNSASIGIELANPGPDLGYIPFPAIQISALKKLLGDITVRHDMDARKAVLAHSDIAPQRKIDPGELFPWQELAQDGFGFWPMPRKEDYAPFAINEVQHLLEAIGYEAALLESAIKAFQRRYHPERLSGVPDEETVARLRALIALQASAQPTDRHSQSLQQAV